MCAGKVIRRPTVYKVPTFTGPYGAGVGIRVCRTCEERNFLMRGGLEDLKKELSAKS